MKNLVVYDSQFGNTEKIAKAIAESIPGTKLLRAAEARAKDVADIDVLIVGSPTQGGRATAAMNQFLDQLPNEGLAQIRVAAFDTRLREEDQNFALRLLIKTIGYAAPKIADVMKNKKGEVTTAPEGFFVKGKDGPLFTGEIERAKKWGRNFYAS